ncbi:MAG: hypothetical protein HY913_13900 [Desulfomonile tiedjei]|nr:hypothetical protein [Desulfomonile tiedjei]
MDYAKFMRKEPSPGLSPQSNRDEGHPVLDADIPWGEVILDSEGESLEHFQPGPLDYAFVSQPPLIPILIVGMFVVTLLL